MTISYSFQVQPAPGAGDWSAKAPGSALGALWRLDTLDLHRVDAEEVLAINRHSRRRAALGAHMQGLLELFQEFRSWDGHREHAQQAFAGRGADPGPVAPLLQDLHAAGLMVSADVWLDRFPEIATAPRQHSGWSLAIATCDRPALLERLLGTLVPYLADLDAPRQVLLIDDSRTPELIERNGEVFAQWRQAAALQGEVWDRARRGHFAALLADAFPAHRRTVRWLFDPAAFPDDVMSVGQVRNLATLLTAGELLLTLDDDSVVRPFRHPANAPGLRLRAHAGDLRPYPDADGLWRQCEPLELNPLRAHLDALGRGLRGAFEVLGQAWVSPDWVGAVDAATHRRLRPDTMVGMTSNAVLGDPGVGDMTAFYAKPSGNLEARVAFLEQWPPEQPLHRHIWRGGVHSWMSFDASLLTSTLTGIDNRQLVPCGGPVGRGSDDRMLGAVFRGLYPQVGQLEFEWALPHLPEQPRPWQRPEPAMQPGTPSPAGLLIDAAAHGASGLRGHGQEQRLSEMADHFRFLAQSPDALLRAYVDERIVEDAAARLRGLRSNFRDPAMRGPMRDDLALLIQAAELRIAQPFVPGVDWLKYFRASCEVYADALLLWPQLRAWVRESPAIPRHAP